MQHLEVFFAEDWVPTRNDLVHNNVSGWGFRAEDLAIEAEQILLEIKCMMEETQSTGTS